MPEPKDRLPATKLMLQHSGQSCGDLIGRRVEILGGGGPAGGTPDFDRCVHADDHRLPFDPGKCPKRRRNQDATLGIELDIDRFREDHASELPDINVRDRQLVDALGKYFPRLHRIQRNTFVKTAREHETAGKLLPEPRRNGEATLGIQIVIVTSKEHRTATLLGLRDFPMAFRGQVIHNGPHLSPLTPTFVHILVTPSQIVECVRTLLSNKWLVSL